jgi:hypothetical protein
MRGLRHLAQRRFAIAGRGVVVEDATQVFELDQLWQAAVLRRLDLAGVLPQFGLDEVEAEGTVKVLFIMISAGSSGALPPSCAGEAILIEREPRSSARCLMATLCSLLPVK